VSHIGTKLEPAFVTPRQLAERLAVPLQTIYFWRHRGDGPKGYVVGKHVRYRPADIEEWLRERADQSRGTA